MSRSLIKDGFWTAGLQGIAAIGQLAAIRLLTEIMTPETFGKLSLCLGVVALVATCMVNPTMQALLRYYHEYTLSGDGLLARNVAKNQLTKMFMWSSPLLIMVTVLLLIYDKIDLIDSILLALLILIEIVRLQNVALLNSARLHRAYGMWAVGEAWCRPILAFVMLKYFGISLSVVISAFLISSVVVWIIMRKYVPVDTNRDWNSSEVNKLSGLFWKYSLPLIPLGVLGWITGMGDRYLINAMLSPADVGIYVAIYGLASRPMLMLGSIIETIYRPVYQNSIITGDKKLASLYLRRWSQLVLITALLAVLVSSFGHGVFAEIMLGEQFRQASYLFPWIVSGYALYLCYQVTGRVCYAFGETKKVLYAEMSGSIVAVISIVVAINYAGLIGAAVAMVFYFGLQFVIGFFLARKVLLKFNNEN